MMRRYLAYHFDQIRRTYHIMMICSGGLGNGPVHMLLESAAEIWFAWDSDIPGWSRPSWATLFDSNFGVLE